MRAPIPLIHEPLYVHGGPREECGVVGVWAPEGPVARLAFVGLHALQHRGQESAGIAVSDGQGLALHKRLGLVSSVFDEETLQRLEAQDEAGRPPRASIGHTRYSTTGSNTLPNVQPVYAESDRGELMLGHNGNLTNARWLRDELTEQGVEFASASDTEVLAKLVAHAPGRSWAQRVDHAFHRATGAYTFTMLTADALVAARDPIGFRPLALGRLPRGGWAVASESAALDAMGAQFVRDVEAGEVLTISADGVDAYRSSRAAPERERLCVFEYVYLARPDSVIDGRLLYEARLEMGRALAREHPADADLVIAVPDSAIPAAIGYAEEAGLPYREGLIKSRYVGRTFIQPAQTGREEAVRLKFNPLPELLSGKRVVVVDDSIVRGTTTAPIVAMLRRAGAAEVHVRIHSPEMRYPCYMGVDTGRRGELIASTHSTDEIRRVIGADSLGYLSREGLLAAVGGRHGARCTACFDGIYPTDVPLELDKLALERR
ncbi:MAG TPA: amidophosphoribosyltransferase [Candidatus Limnocylindria bacterium]|nr:amidophosphoribosyltransferase [Candidatus Limnocylindria bacterium]